MTDDQTEKDVMDAEGDDIAEKLTDRLKNDSAFAQSIFGTGVKQADQMADDGGNEDAGWSGVNVTLENGRKVEIRVNVYP